MELQFDSQLDYQQDAFSAVVDLFEGQEEASLGGFTAYEHTSRLGLEEREAGFANHISLLPEELQENLRAIQQRNGLARTTLGHARRLKVKGTKGKREVELHDYNFDIEMETGTGKTYVYLRSILELHKRYGFCKFIVVVPSIAIKEGVYKTLEITQQHFAHLYHNEPYGYFVYDSAKLNEVNDFATADKVQIMIINIDAFRKSFTDPSKEDKANLIHRPSEALHGRKPIELIQACRPIVIIDEPQSVDNTPKAREAIESLHPACIFRYSATHVKQHHPIYRLNAVDAFQKGLVKQIEVMEFVSQDNHNRAYVRLLSCENKQNSIQACIELDVKEKSGGIKRKTKNVKNNQDLAELSGYDLYKGYRVTEIGCDEGKEKIELNDGEISLRKGDAVGDTDGMVQKELQIRETIKIHLEKELTLRERGVKVLSLFFVDRVANYRSYDAEGNLVKGPYAKMFERLFCEEIAKNQAYQALFKERDWAVLAEQLHNGYFSIDKKGKKDAFKDTRGNTSADEDTFTLIMKDKERLLSFESPLRFIFSHSALAEGWDNPNVFQICTLNERHSDVKKRQEIGRGMRLCVNQKGERLSGNDINTLTVMANESFRDFADSLQKEYEASGIRFGYLERHSFAHVEADQGDGTKAPLGDTLSDKIYDHFVAINYISPEGKAQETLKEALSKNALHLPDEAKPAEREIIVRCNQLVASELIIHNRAERREVKINPKCFKDPEFEALWDRIKFRTRYEVQFDSEKLKKACIARLQSSDFRVPEPRITIAMHRLEVTDSGVEGKITLEKTSQQSAPQALPLNDIVSELEGTTRLTRKTIVEILQRSNTLDQFIRNPQGYTAAVAKCLKEEMQCLLVDGIRYKRLDDAFCYLQESFETEELAGYLNRNMVPSAKSIYDHVIYDSLVEKRFAEAFEERQNVKVFAKLPSWFKIPTPLGNYNPDWAIAVEEEGKEKLYLVVESKGDTSAQALRKSEQDKIVCGKKHFDALGTGVIFEASDAPKDNRLEPLFARARSQKCPPEKEK